jgi:biotin carboxyl carrier protein
LRLEGVLSEIERDASETSGACSVRVDGEDRHVRVLQAGPGRALALVDHRVLRLDFHALSGSVLVSRTGKARSAPLDLRPATQAKSRASTSGGGELRAPMPGRVLVVQANLGDRVERGAPLVLIEAMKMQNQLFAATSGVICNVLVQPGAVVERGALLVRIE